MKEIVLTLLCPPRNFKSIKAINNSEKQKIYLMADYIVPTFEVSFRIINDSQRIEISCKCCSSTLKHVF